MRKFVPYIVAALVLIASGLPLFYVWAIADGIHPPPWASTMLPILGYVNTAFWLIALVFFARSLFRKDARNE
jgi:hypothetical protein